MSMAGGPGRIPAVLFLGIVVVAIAALLAGYGVPAGVGALAGFVLGAMAGLAGVLWLGRGPGRSVNVAGMAWSSDDSRQMIEPLSPHEDLVARIQERSRIFAIDLGRTQSVQPILATAVAGGLEIELLALERHEAGCSLTIETRALPGSAQPPSMAEVSVTDDVGTAYRAAGQGHWGGPVRARFEIRVLPAIAPGAQQLRVRIDQFIDLYPGAPAPVAGPWSFNIAVDNPDHTEEDR